MVSSAEMSCWRCSAVYSLDGYLQAAPGECEALTQLAGYMNWNNSLFLVHVTSSRSGNFLWFLAGAGNLRGARLHRRLFLHAFARDTMSWCQAMCALRGPIRCKAPLEDSAPNRAHPKILPRLLPVSGFLWDNGLDSFFVDFACSSPCWSVLGLF